MTVLRNKCKAPIYVTDKGKDVLILPGRDVDVDGRANWKENPFVIDGDLELVEEDPKPTKNKEKKEPQ